MCLNWVRSKRQCVRLTRLLVRSMPQLWCSGLLLRCFRSLLHLRVRSISTWHSNPRNHNRLTALYIGWKLKGPKTTRPIAAGFEKWVYEDGQVIKLHKKQHMFLTRGSKHIWAFSFPTGILRPLHKKLLQKGLSINLEDLKTCAFVMDIRGMRMPNGDWIRFEEEWFTVACAKE